MQGDDLRPGEVMVFRVGGETADAASRAIARPLQWHPAGDIRVFLIVSRFETDHALTYLFCEGSPSAAQVQAFVEQRPDRYRGSTAVVELAESYYSLEQAKHRALALRTWLSNVNVVFPPLRIG